MMEKCSKVRVDELDAVELAQRCVSSSLEKSPDLDPLFDDLTRAKSAKELKEHLET